MRVVASQIALAATTSVTRSSSESVQGRAWSGNRSNNIDVVQVSEHGRANALQLSGHELSALLVRDPPQHGSSRSSNLPAAGAHEDVTSRASGSDPMNEVDDQDLLGSPDGLKYVVMRRLLEAMTGKRIQLVRTKAVSTSQQSAEVLRQAEDTGAAETATTATQRAGWGYEIEIRRTHTETTSLDFSAQGSIATEDGKMISFDASFIAQSSSVQVESVNLRGGDAQLKDPLVLLYSGTQAELTQQVKSFDLDVDGKLDQLPSLANGAYVARDVNHNGTIDDGSELLGALSGDGFADLTSLDEDGNGFIDRGDSSYDELYLFNPGGAADQQLTSLAKAEVLGLYTGSVSTPLELKSNTGELQGRVRSTGIYVTEDAGVRPMEQIDLKV